MLLTSIIEAMRDSLSIEVTYQSFWRDTPNTFEIHPYCIKVFKQRWYVIGYSPYKESVLIYALDRIKHIHINENKFQLPKNFDGEAFFMDSFGIVAGDGHKTENVLIKVYKIQDSYIRALPLHHSQKEVESTSDYTIFSYHSTRHLSGLFKVDRLIDEGGHMIETCSQVITTMLKPLTCL